MKTRIIKKQNKHRLQLKQLNLLTAWLGEQLVEKTAPQAWGEVSVTLVDDAGITAVNREYFAKNRPTDVISFCYEPIPGEADELGGDLIVNVDRAVQVGAEHDGIDRELALYIAHGFNHLSGADDDTPAKRSAMRLVENAWLKQAETDGLLESLILQEAE